MHLDNYVNELLRKATRYSPIAVQDMELEVKFRLIQVLNVST